MRAPTWSYLRAPNVLLPVRRDAVLLAAFLGLAALAQASGQWKIQFNYQKLDSSLELNDIQCPSSQRCLAAGTILEKSGHSRGVIVLTNDGGKQWSTVELREHPISLFFLNDTMGWMVTDRGIWSTEESGRAWKKLWAVKGIVRVHFLDASHGFAVGYPKAAYETMDGGKKWTKLAAAGSQSIESKESKEISYDCIAFSGQHGVIVGNQIRPEDPDSPIWLNPELARLRQERQAKAPILETFDGGKKWQGATISVVGTISQVKFDKDGNAVMLVEYRNYFALPASVYKTKAGHELETIFEERDRAVTDVAMLPDGGAMLASIEPPGSSNQVPIPGKLKMLGSNNLKLWEEVEIDYRAVARRAVLAAVDAKHAWVATDTGMILGLVDSENRAQ